MTKSSDTDDFVTCLYGRALHVVLAGDATTLCGRESFVRGLVAGRSWCKKCSEMIDFAVVGKALADKTLTGR